MAEPVKLLLEAAEAVTASAFANAGEAAHVAACFPEMEALLLAHQNLREFYGETQLSIQDRLVVS